MVTTTPPTSRPARLLLAAIGLVLLGVGGLMLVRRLPPRAGQEPAAQVATAVPMPSPPAPPFSAPPVAAPGPAPAAPPAAGYDVVLVAPGGGAVLAGRATAGAHLVIRDDAANGAVVGEVTADARGNWVLTPSGTLAPGPHSLVIEEILPDGSVARAGEPALVSVPEPGHGETALAVVLPEHGAPKVLGAPPAPPDRPVIDAMSYGSDGGLALTGRAPPGALMGIFLDNHPVSAAVADPSGAWSADMDVRLALGRHRLRIDMMNANGKVLARAQIGFERGAEGVAMAAPPAPRANAPGGTPTRTGAVMVRPGETLWEIARGAYGDGVRYVTIFSANRGQISDPSLIYPGQTFVLPRAPAGGSIPDSSSRSR